MPEILIRLIRRPRHQRRWLLVVAACAAVALMGERRPAGAASVEDCRAFHQECMEAKAAGYRDVGICNVERLECPARRDVSVPRRLHEGRDDDDDAYGSRAKGPIP